MERGSGSEKEVTKLRTMLTWTVPGRHQMENFWVKQLRLRQKYYNGSCQVLHVTALTHMGVANTVKFSNLVWYLFCDYHISLFNYYLHKSICTHYEQLIFIQVSNTIIPDRFTVVHFESKIFQQNKEMYSE